MKIKLVLSSLSLNLLAACTSMPTSTMPARLSSTPPSYADTDCGRHFSSSGTRNGIVFSTFATFPDLDVRSAMGQIENLAISQGMQIGSDQVDSEFGKVTIIARDPHGRRDYPIMAEANKASGRVALVTQSSPRQILDEDLARDHMCFLLSELKMDAAGASVAEATLKKLGSGQVIDIKAVDLAQEVAEALRKQRNAFDVAMRYTGKVYRIDGQVSQPTMDSGVNADVRPGKVSARSFSIPYHTEVPAGLMGARSMKPTRVQILCHTAPDQFQRFSALKEGDHATLIGTVTSFNESDRPKSILNGSSHGGILDMDCRFEK